MLPFWEAYFSNFIEGTEFTPDEAERIVFEGEVPTARPTRMDWSTLTVSRQLLEQANAFVDPNDAEDRGLHLLDPIA